MMTTQGALSGLRVLDASSLFAGPLGATLLADFGADVVKIEHPNGDAARSHGPTRNGIGLWWKPLNRNKRFITILLSHPEGQRIFLRLCEKADVVIENFRPGTLERWHIGPGEMHARNSRLVIIRVTAFGQQGPRAKQPGFGTLAEAMSGFAHMTGEADRPPTLPPIALADGVAGLTAAYAAMVALRARELTGRGEIVDIALLEPIMMLLGSIMRRGTHIVRRTEPGWRSRRVPQRSLNGSCALSGAPI
jgi:crotonobetainyl-CoA:carnitine CoA-transferase CaiB-like acyl-CoA transferase